MVFQESASALPPHFSAAEIIEEPLVIQRRYSPKERSELVSDLMIKGRTAPKLEGPASASVQQRPAPAFSHCAGPGVAAQPSGSRRAVYRARPFHARTIGQFAVGVAGRAFACVLVHFARSRSGSAFFRRCDGAGSWKGRCPRQNVCTVRRRESRADATRCRRKRTGCCPGLEALLRTAARRVRAVPGRLVFFRRSSCCSGFRCSRLFSLSSLPAIFLKK